MEFKCSLSNFNPDICLRARPRIKDGQEDRVEERIASCKNQPVKDIYLMDSLGYQYHRSA